MSNKKKMRAGDRVRVAKRCADLGLEIGTRGRVAWAGGGRVDIAFDRPDMMMAGVEDDHSALEVIPGHVKLMTTTKSKNLLDAEVALMSGAPVNLAAVYGLAAEKAFPSSAMRGLKGRARRDAELVRSGAIQMERLRCQGRTDDQLRARLRELLKEAGGAA